MYASNPLDDSFDAYVAARAWFAYAQDKVFSLDGVKHGHARRIAITLSVYLSLGLAVSALMNWYNARMALVTR